MKYYIAGPMSGYENYNFDEFDRAEKRLLIKGHKVVNPAAIGRVMLKENRDFQYQDFLKADLNELLKCDAIYMLKDWHKSPGALLEHQIAIALRLHIFYQTQEGC